MSVGIEDEGGKIVGTMLRMKSRSTIVSSAVFERRAVEGDDRVVRARSERNMEAIARDDHRLRAKANGKFILAPRKAVAHRDLLKSGARFMRPRADVP